MFNLGPFDINSNLEVKYTYQKNISTGSRLRSTRGLTHSKKTKTKKQKKCTKDEAIHLPATLGRELRTKEKTTLFVCFAASAWLMPSPDVTLFGDLI